MPQAKLPHIAFLNSLNLPVSGVKEVISDEYNEAAAKINSLLKENKKAEAVKVSNQLIGEIKKCLDGFEDEEVALALTAAKSAEKQFLNGTSASNNSTANDVTEEVDEDEEDEDEEEEEQDKKPKDNIVYWLLGGAAILGSLFVFGGGLKGKKQK